MLNKILLIWAILDVIVYAVLWFDTVYYEHDLPKLYKRILDAFTEED